MRVNEYSNVYDMDWEHVTSAFWKKYCNRFFIAFRV